MQYPEICMLIGVGWRSSSRHAPIVNPAEETIIGQVPHVLIADLENAVSAAVEGFRIWGSTAPDKRVDIILESARLIRERVEQIAFAITLEQGKPIAQSRLRCSEAVTWSNGKPPRVAAFTPFGGVKGSGYGRTGGTEGLKCYSMVKNVSCTANSAHPRQGADLTRCTPYPLA